MDKENFEIGEEITEAALSDTYIFKAFNNNGEINKSIILAIKKSIVLGKNYIQEQLLQMSRTKISPLSEKVLQAYNDGKIVLLYALDSPMYEMIPYFVTKTPEGIKAYIFVNRYGTISKNVLNSEDKYLNISMKDLYTLLEGAYVAYSYTTNQQKFTRSLGMMKTSSYIYTYMFLRILNKEYGISMDQMLHNRVVFTLSKFFLTRVWGCDVYDLVDTYAKANIKNTAVDVSDLMTVSKLYDDAEIENINDLFNFLKTLSPRMSSMNTRYMIQCFITMFKAPALFGCESLQYFLFCIQSSVIGSYIVNAAMVLDVIKSAPGMNTFYSELSKACN